MLQTSGLFLSAHADWPVISTGTPHVTASQSNVSARANTACTPRINVLNPAHFNFTSPAVSYRGRLGATPPHRYAGSISGIDVITPLSTGDATVTENVTLIRLKPNNGNDSNHSVTLTVTLNNQRGDTGAMTCGEPCRWGRGWCPSVSAMNQRGSLLPFSMRHYA